MQNNLESLSTDSRDVRSQAWRLADFSEVLIWFYSLVRMYRMITQLCPNHIFRLTQKSNQLSFSKLPPPLMYGPYL